MAASDGPGQTTGASGEDSSPSRVRSSEVDEEIGARDAKPAPNIDSKARTRRFETLTDLKEFYGEWILKIMAAQLVVVNAIFVLYAWVGYHWQPPTSVVEFWISATFVQIISVVVAITKSLFPKREEDE